MALQHSDGLANFILNSGFGTAFDTDGRIAIFAGTVPSSPGAAIANTLLGTLVLGSDAFAAAASRAVAANAITNDSSADNSGTPSFFVMYRASDTALTSSAGSSDRRMIGTIGGRTTLNGAINNSVTTIAVANAAVLPSSGEVIIDTERITYTGKSGNDLTGCTRGTNGTTAASHSNGVAVYQYGYDMHSDNMSFVAGGVISATSFTYTHPA